MSIQVQLRRDTATNIKAAAAGAVGEVWVDTTSNRMVVNDGATLGGFPAPVTLSVQNGGNTNNSIAGSGVDFDHNLTFSIPASFMVSGRAFRVTAHFVMNTGTAPPTLVNKLKLGTIVTSAHVAQTPAANLVNISYAIQWIFQATAVPGASVNVQTSPLVTPSGIPGAAQQGTIAQPVAIATNAAQAVKITTLWSAAGTGTNTIALSQLIVEALN